MLDDPELSEEIATLEASLPVGVRVRQLPVRSFFLGILLSLTKGHQAFLTGVHEALCSLDDQARSRLGVITTKRGVSHLLTYRQIEYLAKLIATSLRNGVEDGLPQPALTRFLDRLVEASVPADYRQASRSVAVDWTDFQSFCHPPSKDGACADPEASWGHRSGGGPGEKSELFFGYFLTLFTMVKEESGPNVAELVRQMSLSSCRHDPVRVAATALEHRARSGVRLGDVLADSGYAHRVAEHFALPVRALGGDLVMDLHPHDRGPKGTLSGAILHNGNCFCPATPKTLFSLGPLARQATPTEIEEHDRRTAELSRYKLGQISSDDADGYFRVQCPALLNKCRCPLRPESMALGYERPEILAPPEHPALCCTQKTFTVPPTVNAKTRQKHDYPSKAHRLSYARRTAVERSNSRIKDPASIDINKGWCRLMGLVAPSLFIAMALMVRNNALVDSFEASEKRNAKHLALGLEPPTRRRRRVSLTELAGINS